MPPVRTPNQCCIDNAIQQLSFDTTLQDLAWRKAQARPRRPFEALEKCQTRNQDGEVVCESSLQQVLHSLGLCIDPVSKSVVAAMGERATSPVHGSVSARRWALTDLSNAPLVQQRDDVLASLAHRHLLLHLPNSDRVQTKTPTSMEDYLKRFPRANRIQLLAELAACLQYLHTRKIIHGSIRPDHLFVDDEGFALLQLAPGVAAAPIKPSDPYSSPELQSSHGTPTPTIAADIYSFGSVMHWVCTGQDPKPTSRSSSPNSTSRPGSPRPLTNSNQPSSSDLLAGSSSSSKMTPLQPLDMRLNLADWTDSTLKNLVQQCRDRNPHKRPPMISVVLSLQQIKARHLLPTLQLRLITAPLSSYLPQRQALSVGSSPRMSSDVRIRPRTPQTAVRPLRSVSPYGYSPRTRPPQEVDALENYIPPSVLQYYLTAPGGTNSRERSPLLPGETIPRGAHERTAAPPTTTTIPPSTFDPFSHLDQSSNSLFDCLPELHYFPPDGPDLNIRDFLPLPPATAHLHPPLPPDHWESQGANIHRNRTL